MLYPTEVIEEVRAENDIVSVIGNYVRLTQKGNSFFGICPFHNESTPSFSVRKDKQMYYCFGCGASGNVINFVRQIENYDFVMALKFLADRVNYTLPEKKQDENYKKILKQKDVLFNIHVVAAKFFYDNLQSPQGKMTTDYLDNRNVSNKMRKKFGLGYSLSEWDSLFVHLTKQGFDLDSILKSGLVLQSKKNATKCFDRFRDRLMFPIIDFNGKIIGFGGRILENADKDSPKYLNSPETIIFDKSKNLYALNIARKSLIKEVILVEGYMDTISLHQAGFSNVVASLGTAFNKGHANLIKKFFDKATILFDADNAGIAATIRAIPVLTSIGLGVNVMAIEGAKDPDEFIIKFGKDKFADYLNKSKDYLSFQIELLAKKYDLSKSRDKSDFIKEASKLLANLNDIDKSIYATEIKKLTGIDEELIESNVNLLTDEFDKQVDENIKKQSAKKVSAKEKGLYDAQDYLIYIISKDIRVYKAVKEYLSPDELLGETYKSILKVIYELRLNNNDTNAANISTYFEEKQDLSLIYNIFNMPLMLDDYGKIEKAINDNVKLIKEYNIQIMSQNENNDDKALNQIFMERKNLKILNITLIDG